MAKTSVRWWRRPWVLITSGVVVVVIIAGGFILFVRHADRASASTTTYQVATGTAQQTVSATGTVEPANEADLSFSSSGTVSSVDVHVGDKVTKGQPLASIDPATLQSSLQLAQAVVTQAQAAATSATGGSATQVASAQAQLASANAGLAAAQTALTQATLTSPINGVVAALNVSVGSNVSGTSSASSSGRGAASPAAAASTGAASTGASSAAVSVISTDAWVVQAAVSSSDLPNLKPGLQVQITPSGARQAVFGTVESVGIVASTSSSGSAAFPVEIAVTGNPGGLYAGSSASVSIIVKELDDVLLVPTLAVHTTNGKTEVTLVKGGRDVETPVTVGGVFGARTEVTKGLSSGDQIVLPVFSAGTTSGTGTRGFGGGGFGGGGFGGGAGFGGGNRTGGTGTGGGSNNG